MFIKIGDISGKNAILLVLPIISIIKLLLGKKLFSQEKDSFCFVPLTISLCHIICGIFWIARVKSNLRHDKVNRLTCDNFSSLLNIYLPNDIDNKVSNVPSNKEIGKSAIELNALEQKNKKKKKRRREIIYFIILGILNFLCGCIKVLLKKFRLNESKYEIERLVTKSTSLQQVSIALLTALLNSNSKLYRHQIIALIAIPFVVIVYNTTSLIKQTGNSGENKFLIEILTVTPEIIISFYYVLGKKYISFSYKTPYKLLFFIGIVSFACFVPLFLWTVYGNCYFVKNFYQYIKIEGELSICNNKNEFISISEYLSSIGCFDRLFAILFIFIELFEIIITWLIISSFSPNHYAASNCICSFLTPFFYGKIHLFVLYIIVYSIIFFMLLVFNEMIVLNICYLEENTAEEIRKRAENDYSIEEVKDSLKLGFTSDPNGKNVKELDTFAQKPESENEEQIGSNYIDSENSEKIENSLKNDNFDIEE